MMRVLVNLSKDDRGCVEQFADEHGITMPSAYGELIRQALREEGYDVDGDVVEV